MAEIFTERHKRVIAGRARTLRERFADPESLEESQISHTDRGDIFDKWKDLFPSDKAFDQRLEQLEMTKDECRDAIYRDKLSDEEPLPSWLETLEELIMTVQEKDPENLLNNSHAEKEISTKKERSNRPFPELSIALSEYAKDEIQKNTDIDILSENAIESVMDWFRRRFEQRFVRILFVEFKTYVASHDKKIAFSDPDEFDELPTKYYRGFIKYMFSGGFADLCQEYPLFARLVVSQVSQLNEVLCEFCYRVKSDRQELRDSFGTDSALSQIRELEPLAEDTHGDGRAIMRVEFKSGFTIVYKPRNVEIGEAFYQAIRDLNNHIPVPDFKTPTYLSRDNYGWMEWIEYEECAGREEVERYYKRAGSLVCISYFLGFTDCQFENVIVSGEHPLLIDAETVLHPYISTERRPIRTGIGTLQADSVLLTSLLPFGIDKISLESDQNRMMESIAGFSVSEDNADLKEIVRPVIKASNTDVMSVESKPAEIERSENIPRIEGRSQPPEKYLDEIIEGFKATYKTILQLRDRKLLSEKIRVPDCFESIENRVVYRPTAKYMSVIRSLCSRSNLQSGASFGVEMEKLAVPFSDGQVTDSKPWSLYDAERKALKRLDPPRFTSQTDETKIKWGGIQLDVQADESGIDHCRKRIQSADNEDMKKQIEIIRGCFGSVPDSSQNIQTTTASTRETISNDQLRREATRLFKRIQSAALESDEGMYYWGSIAPWNEKERLTVRPADGSLYAGRCGIGLLGAGLYQITGEDQYQTFARDAIRPICKSLSSDQMSPALSHHGGTTGIGSIAYGMGTIGGLLDDETILRTAARTASLITEDTLRKNNIFDVTGGAAGTILGLLGLHDRYTDPELISAAGKCGDHLLNARTSTNDCQVWKTLDDCPPLTGFAHGVSGIAYALIRLSDVTGDSVYRDAALEALEYESKAYSADEKNWVDYRPWTSEHLNQWCYGRSGIGLARFGMEDYTSDKLITRDIERSLEGIETKGLRPLDNICCGEAGRAEFLLEAERRHNHHPGEARRLLGGIYSRREERGSYSTPSATNQVTDPTFFNGLSGIAYTMLRVTAPKKLPCVLVWE